VLSFQNEHLFVCFMINNKLITKKQNKKGLMNEAFWARRLREWRRLKNRSQIVSAMQFFSRIEFETD